MFFQGKSKRNYKLYMRTYYTHVNRYACMYICICCSRENPPSIPHSQRHHQHPALCSSAKKGEKLELAIKERKQLRSFSLFSYDYNYMACIRRKTEENANRSVVGHHTTTTIICHTILLTSTYLKP